MSARNVFPAGQIIKAGGLEYIASQVAGRAVTVGFATLDDEVNGDFSTYGQGKEDEIRLSRAMIQEWRDPSRVFLHELAHAVLHRGQQPSQRAEAEAEDFAHQARGYFPRYLFQDCLRYGFLTQREYSNVIAGLRAVAAEFQTQQPVQQTGAKRDDGTILITPEIERRLQANSERLERMTPAQKIQEYERIQKKIGETSKAGFLIQRSIDGLRGKDREMRRETAMLPTATIYTN